MKILVVAATALEIEPFRKYSEEKIYIRKDYSVEILITGVGMLQTAYSLTTHLIANQYDLVIQAGIGGSFHPLYPPGAVLLIKDDTVGDLGVEENGTFMDLFDMKLLETHYPFTANALTNPHYQWLDKLKNEKVNAVSVNEITTRSERIDTLRQKYNATIESMEGAAFHFVCLQQQVPFLQLRSVSNFVGERDKTKWDLKGAVTNLNETLIQFSHSLMC